MVDENDQVVINSPETIAALEYAKELYQTFVPGTLSWLDPSNNKAFLDGQISWTINGISVYYAAKNSEDAKIKALVDDIGHAILPVGPVGHPTELHLTVPAMVFAYTKYPNAAKDYIRFMLEREQYVPWQEASIGYFSQPLREYEKSPIWTADPKHTPYRDLMANMLWPGYAGSLGYASAGRDGRLRHGQHGGAGGLGRQDRRKTPRPRRRSAPSATTRSEASAGRHHFGTAAKGALVRVAAMTPQVVPRLTSRRRWRSCSTTARCCRCCSCCRRPRSCCSSSPIRSASGSGWDLPMSASAGPASSSGSKTTSRSSMTTCSGCRSSTRSSTPSSRRSLKFGLGLWLALLLNHAHPVQGLHPRHRAAALYRADRAVGDRLLVDLRSAVFDRLVVAARSWG